MKRNLLFGALMSLAVCPFVLRTAEAQAPGGEAGSPRVEAPVQVGNQLFVLQQGGGNAAVFITDLGVVVVDTKRAGSGPAMMDGIRAVTSKPVTTLVNTHAHPDHTGGNDLFGTSVQIVAHENTRDNMEKTGRFTGRLANFLPKLMFKEKMSLGSGQGTVQLHYFGAGHTNGDAWVVFPALRVMHAGDMFPGKQVPMIDGSNGGSGLAYPDTLARAAALENIDIIIAGHGGLMTMADLEEYERFNRDFRDVVVDGFNRGLSVREVVGRWRLSEKYAGYAAPAADRVTANVEQMFGELAR